MPNIKDVNNQFDNVRDIIQSIYRSCGGEIIADSGRLQAYYADLAPNQKKEMVLLKSFLECNGNRALLNAIYYDPAQQLSSIAIVAKNMNEQKWIPADTAISFCNAFYRGIGGQYQLRVNNNQDSDQATPNPIVITPPQTKSKRSKIALIASVGGIAVLACIVFIIAHLAKPPIDPASFDSGQPDLTTSYSGSDDRSNTDITRDVFIGKWSDYWGGYIDGNTIVGVCVMDLQLSKDGSASFIYYVTHTDGYMSSCSGTWEFDGAEGSVANVRIVLKDDEVYEGAPNGGVHAASLKLSVDVDVIKVIGITGDAADIAVGDAFEKNTSIDEWISRTLQEADNSTENQERAAELTEKAISLYKELLIAFAEKNYFGWDGNYWNYTAYDGTEYNCEPAQQLMIADLNGDNVPELVLGGFFDGLYIFGLDENQIVLFGRMYIHNQGGDPVLLKYMENASKKVLVVSAGETGSGAGEYGFIEYTVPGTLEVSTNSFTYAAFDVMKPNNKTYAVNGEAVDQQTYTTAVDSFYSGLTLMETLYYEQINDDPMAAFAAAVLKYNQSSQITTTAKPDETMATTEATIVPTEANSAENPPQPRTALQVIDEIESFREKNKTYSLEDLIELTEDLNVEEYSWKTITIGNVVIEKYNGEWYTSLQAIYFGADGNVVYGDDYTWTTDPSENTYGATYSCWVTSSVYDKIKKITSSKGNEYYWYESIGSIDNRNWDYHSFYLVEYVNGYVTEEFLPKEFYED